MRTEATFAEGLDAWRDQRPDCVLLDVRLGPTSGLDLLAQVRAEGLDSGPVLLHTSEPVEEVWPRAGALGAAGFVAKPADHEVVAAAVADALAGRITPPVVA